MDFHTYLLSVALALRVKQTWYHTESTSWASPRNTHYICYVTLTHTPILQKSPSQLTDEKTEVQIEVAHWGHLTHHWELSLGVRSRIPPFIYSFLPLGLYLTHSNCTNPLGAIRYQCRHSTCKEHDVIDQGDWHAFHALLHVATRLCWTQTLLSIWRQSLGLKAQAGLELKIFLPRPLECWRLRHTPVTLSFNPVLANHSFPWIIYLSLKLREDDSGFADWCAFRPMCSFSKLDATLP